MGCGYFLVWLCVFAVFLSAHTLILLLLLLLLFFRCGVALGRVKAGKKECR